MKEIEIVILGTSDVHGKISSVNHVDKTKDDQKGMAKAATYIQAERKLNKHVLLIDNGDLIQGTPFAHYAMTETEVLNPIVQVLDYLQYDAAVLGNHEFNYGKERLDKVVSQSSFPWLSANIVKKGTNEPYFGQPYMIKEFDGVKVAVLGLTTKYIPHWESDRHIEAFDFLDPVDKGREWVRFLKEEEQSDIVIVSYHGGFEYDPVTNKKIAEHTGENQANELQALEGVDVLLTGHQHLQYAVVTEEQKVMLQPGTQAEFVGKVDLTVRKEGNEVSIQKVIAELIPINLCMPDDTIVSMLKPIELEVDEWLDEKIATVSHRVAIEDPIHDVWLQEHPFIEWINRAMMKHTGAAIACTSLLRPDTLDINEAVSRRDVHALYPYPNSLAVVELTSEDIRQALEVSASFLMVHEDGQVYINSDWERPRLLSYNYDMWEGIEYTIDLRRPIGERVVDLSLDGEPLKNGLYEVVTSSYRASGSGGYYMFGKGKIIKDYNRDMVELLVEDLKREGELLVEVNQNWKVIY
ncbi:bifunctional UDP-sugar hydrolase/5'-nucleotidase [Halalkalibacter sp. APA_J-10(15)]|uniref:bifunctional metallophosphatase/5'-nucleotidase n=1 Tax=Halalkalibacter sp. APA_J-10(15) TaxID=2933805 RepID=UPI001FF194A7|nr:bifunctional UDP-sugar hydrolase/5'-nucleotidase [Halalkalibacter sp. APA_J-10(15)]MCK0471827.1 bifunctional metallophosphatase/5'-nucleotidase [Halalkalibacter sp. APA_J-10(15)]